MEKVNANREFKKRTVNYSAFNNSPSLFEQSNRLPERPCRLECRVHETNTAEFEHYLALALTPVLGVSNKRVHVTKHYEFCNYHISINIEKKDIKLLSDFLYRVCEGLENFRKGNM